jgi:hypothetical protein
MFDRIHCSFSRFIDEFDWFIGKIDRYSSVGDFTVYIFNQIDFGRFLPNLADFFLKIDRIRGKFLVSINLLNTKMTSQSHRSLTFHPPY